MAPTSMVLVLLLSGLGLVAAGRLGTGFLRESLILQESQLPGSPPLAVTIDSHPWSALITTLQIQSGSPRVTIQSRPGSVLVAIQSRRRPPQGRAWRLVNATSGRLASKVLRETFVHPGVESRASQLRERSFTGHKKLRLRIIGPPEDRNFIWEEITSDEVEDNPQETYSRVEVVHEGFDEDDTDTEGVETDTTEGDETDTDVVIGQMINTDQVLPVGPIIDSASEPEANVFSGPLGPLTAQVAQAFLAQEILCSMYPRLCIPGMRDCIPFMAMLNWHFSRTFYLVYHYGFSFFLAVIVAIVAIFIAIYVGRSSDSHTKSM